MGRITLHSTAMCIDMTLNFTQMGGKNVQTGTESKNVRVTYSGLPRNLFSGGVQQIQLRTEDRTGIWGAVDL